VQIKGANLEGGSVEQQSVIKNYREQLI
jgi:hypothetical protein